MLHALRTCLSLAVVLLCLGAVLVGCKKKEVAAPAAPPPEAAAPAAEPAAAPQNAPAAPVNAINTADVKAEMAAAAAAQKARDYDRAAKSILALQEQARLTEQQQQALHAQMVQLQSAVAAALASGDPKAQAAAETLRASSLHR